MGGEVFKTIMGGVAKNNPMLSAVSGAVLGKKNPFSGALELSTAVGQQNQGRADSMGKLDEAVKKNFPELGGDTSPWAGMRNVGPVTSGQQNPNLPAVGRGEPEPTFDAQGNPSGAPMPGQPQAAVVTPTTPAPVVQSQTPGVAPSSPNMAAYRQAIKDIESSGGNYRAVGPTTAKGDRALGAYQVMASNVPSWTKEVLGRSMTPQEFINDDRAQDAVFDYQFGKSIQRHGTPQDAASVWFTGRPTSSASAGGATDILGTSGNDYVRKFNNALGTNKRSAPPGIGPGVDTSQPTIDLGGGPQYQPKQPVEPWQKALEGDGKPNTPTQPAPIPTAYGTPSVPAVQEAGAPNPMDTIIAQIKQEKNTSRLRGMQRKDQIALLMRQGALARENRNKDTA